MALAMQAHLHACRLTVSLGLRLPNWASNHNADQPLELPSQYKINKIIIAYNVQACPQHL